jgi:hypothetical protein
MVTWLHSVAVIVQKFIIVMPSIYAQTADDIYNVTVTHALEDVVVLVCNLITTFTWEGGECNIIQGCW